MPKVLALVPARAGSKGLKNKNLLKVHGKYLLEWISEVVSSSDLVDKLICSTDSREIAALAFKLGYDVDIRPEKYATDDSKIIDTILHVIKKKVISNYDYLLLLQATSPCIVRSDINRALDAALEYDYDTVISAYKDEHVSFSTLFFPCKNNLVTSLDVHSSPDDRRQDSIYPYIRAGLFYLFKIPTILKLTSLYGGRTGYVLVPKSRTANLDHPDDLLVLSNQLKALNDDIRFN